MLSEGKTFSVGGVGINIPGNKVVTISGMFALGQALPGLGHLQNDSNFNPMLPTGQSRSPACHSSPFRVFPSLPVSLGSSPRLFWAWFRRPLCSSLQGEERGTCLGTPFPGSISLTVLAQRPLDVVLLSLVLSNCKTRAFGPGSSRNTW